jgi:CDP-diacylglycerol---serine O-phosphatidyltransferase
VIAIMGAVVFAGLLASEPWLMLTVCAIAYLAFLPLSARSYWRRDKAQQKDAAPQADSTPAA